MNIDEFFPETRKRRRKCLLGEVEEDNDILGDSESHFKEDVFIKIIDSVTQSLTRRFNAASDIYEIFCFLWSYLETDFNQIILSCSKFAEFYKNDVVEADILEEVKNIKSIHSGNL